MKQIENPMYSIIKSFFDRIVYLKHCGKLINATLNSEDSYPYEYSGISLIITDWTGAYDYSKEDLKFEGMSFPKGTRWAKPFHSGSHDDVEKHERGEFFQKLQSEYYQYLFVQTFEALQASWKNIVRLKEVGLYSPQDRIRSNDLIKEIKQLTIHKYNTIRLAEIETVLSECRHSITHANSLIQHKKIFKSAAHEKIFEHIFNSIQYTSDHSQIILDYPLFDKLLDFTSNFNFQIYKFISLNKGWSITYGFEGYEP